MYINVLFLLALSNCVIGDGLWVCVCVGSYLRPGGGGLCVCASWPRPGGSVVPESLSLGG